MQSIAQGKQDARKEKLGQADKLQGKIDHIDMQIAGNKERLATQDFSAGQAQKVRDENARLEQQKEAFHAGEGAKDRGARRGDILLQGKINQGIHAQDNASEQEKARLHALATGAAAGGGKVSDGDKGFYTNIGAGMSAVKDIREMVGKGGASLAGIIQNGGEPRALLDQGVANLAHALTKIKDPTSAVLLAELESTTKNMLANPDTTRTSIFMAKVRAAEKQIVAHALDYSAIAPQVPMHPLVQDYMQRSATGNTASPATGGGAAPKHSYVKWDD